VIDRRIAVLEAEGVAIRCGVTVGDDPTWTQLRAEHDAVVIAIGASRPRDLTVPGRSLDGIVLAMDYLTDQNAVIGGEHAAAACDVSGKRVVILGGGDTGSDCLGTALRQRAAQVTQIELMPAPPATRADANPWPTWPYVFRTSSSQEEGGQRRFAFRTTHLEGENGRLVALHGERVGVLAETERRPEHLAEPEPPDQRGTSVRIPADVLILALGFLGPDTKALVAEFGVALDARGNIAIDDRYATSVPGVYCAGDAHRGASLIVWAIAEGRELARNVDSGLRHAHSTLPARGHDSPF
jgi:glutamate synthase (NADPH/NADH) small chain